MTKENKIKRSLTQTARSLAKSLSATCFSMFPLLSFPTFSHSILLILHITPVVSTPSYESEPEQSAHNTPSCSSSLSSRSINRLLGRQTVATGILTSALCHGVMGPYIPQATESEKSIATTRDNSVCTQFYILVFSTFFLA